MYIDQFSYGVLWFRQVLSILGYADSFLTRDGVLVKQQKRLKFYIIAVYNTLKALFYIRLCYSIPNKTLPNLRKTM